MEFAEVVMKRRARRRFKEGGVDREVIERIARLAQRTPSAVERRTPQRNGRPVGAKSSAPTDPYGAMGCPAPSRTNVTALPSFWFTIVRPEPSRSSSRIQSVDVHPV